MQITRGPAPRSHLFPKETKPTLIGYCTSLSRPLQLQTNGMTAVTIPDIRWLQCDIKSLNLLPNTLAKQEAADAGAEEAILHRDGIVTECSASNLMMVRNGIIHTHPANHLILHGITREIVLRLAAEEGITIIEEPFHLGDLRTADELFITSTTVEIASIVEVDGYVIGGGIPGPLTRKLQQLFESKIQSTT
ncbi:aminotransferase class IV [Marinicrinis lubricantis]